MHFHDVSSDTPLHRALTRLVQRKYLARIERRMVGGTGAGSGQYVYQLGRQGWALANREGKYWPQRSVSYHTLAIADAYVAILEQAQAGKLEIESFTTEPDSWVEMSGVILRPDLFVEVTQPWKSQHTALWLEIDMGTERQKQIKDKLANYYHVYKHASGIPQVVLLAPDDQRARDCAG